VRHAVLPWLLSVLLTSTACGPSSELYQGMPDHVRRRHVALDGAHNFRDLGGYRTRDGRSVRWGLFYRSDHLADLSDADLETFAALGIRLVCDFRSPEEKAEEPDRLPASSPPAVAELEIFDESFSPKRLREAISSGELGDDPGSVLVQGNRLFATRFSDRYAAMFERLRRPENLPALVHCTAGKDRAGFASALILRVLGVPVETVYEDFLLTNHYTAARIEWNLWLAEVFSLGRADAEALRSLMGVERRFLEAAFDEVALRYGDFESYRRGPLGLDDAELAAFRDLALE
jgi:protein-tyrosine phosphatase